MSKDPAFLFYSQDFIVGIQTMDWEERGKYITLLAQMHQQGRLTEKTIRFLVGNVSDNLKDKFKVDKEGRWYNQRLEEEIEKRRNFVESRRLNGVKGGRPTKPTGKPIGKAKDNLPEDVNEDVVKDKNGIDYPFSGKFKEKWKEWKLYLWNEHQQEYKSEQSEKSALKSLVGLANNIEAKAVKCIDHSMGKRYKAIYEPTSSNGHSKPDEQPVPRSQKPLKRD